MSNDYSLTNFNKFLDYVIDRGLMKPETAKGRKRAANSILGILEPEECTDLRNIDVDLVSHRFANLQGGDFKPASLKVYQSRLRSALTDFFRYVDDPISFKPSVNTRRTSPENGKPSKKPKKVEPKEQSSPLRDDNHNYSETGTHSNLVFPVPIRPGMVVKVSNIPDDLTQAEADKIAAVIKALAMTSPE